MRRVLIAPDKFKGSLTGYEVAAAVRRGLNATRPDIETMLLPVADGGDGTLEAAHTAGYARVPVTVHGPTGETVETAYARQGTTALVELAETCGLARLPLGTTEPMTASSRGLGEAMVAALDAGCRTIVLGIGGSASTDGGSGMVSALGARLLDENGDELPDGGGPLAGVAELDLSGWHPALAEAEVVVACDVDSPLTGPCGAAAVYGPQKGADPEQVRTLDAALSRWADLVADRTGADERQTPGAGAAGGVGFAALALLGARLRPGIDLMLDLLAFDRHLEGVDLVVTGEGSLDEQSLRGKAPVGVAAAARRHDVPVVAVCGRRAVGDAVLREAGIEAVYPLTDLEPDQARCIEDAAALLERLGARLATEWGG